MNSINVICPSSYPLQIQRKENQSSLKGYCWFVGGATLGALPPALAGLTIVLGVGTVISLGSDPITVIPLLSATAATALTTHIALKCLSTCYHNAFYHFGPKHEIVEIYSSTALLPSIQNQ